MHFTISKGLLCAALVADPLLVSALPCKDGNCLTNLLRIRSPIGTPAHAPATPHSGPPLPQYKDLFPNGGPGETRMGVAPVSVEHNVPPTGQQERLAAPGGNRDGEPEPLVGGRPEEEPVPFVGDRKEEPVPVTGERDGEGPPVAGGREGQIPVVPVGQLPSRQVIKAKETQYIQIGDELYKSYFRTRGVTQNYQTKAQAKEMLKQKFAALNIPEGKATKADAPLAAEQQAMTGVRGWGGKVAGWWRNLITRKNRNQEPVMEQHSSPDQRTTSISTKDDSLDAAATAELASAQYIKAAQENGIANPQLQFLVHRLDGNNAAAKESKRFIDFYIGKYGQGLKVGRFTLNREKAGDKANGFNLFSASYNGKTSMSMNLGSVTEGGVKTGLLRQYHIMRRVKAPKGTQNQQPARNTEPNPAQNPVREPDTNPGQAPVDAPAPGTVTKRQASAPEITEEDDIYEYSFVAEYDLPEQ